jgi:hypothetical protein
MPKKSVLECGCDRCGRVWYEEIVQAKDGLPVGSKVNPCGSFKMELVMPDGKITKVVYEVMCETCSTSVANYATNIARDLKTVSKAKKGTAEAAPTPPPAPSHKKK